MKSRYDDPAYQKQVANQMLATPTLEIACRAITDQRLQIQHDAVYVDDLLQRIKDLETLYSIVTGPEGDGGKFNYFMQQLEKRFIEGELTKRSKEQVNWFLREIDEAMKDRRDLIELKRKVLNIFTGGKLFNGEQN